MLPCAVPSASDGQMGNTFECTSFKNPDGKIALAICNRNEEAVSFKLECDSCQTSNAPLFCPAHAIQTILIDI
ncbi:glycoside hydrolase family 30 beta sandwich domain-containing protein [uncultured Treponema sp.]|uniref:glycoside hydrolase family 30 beta sandwich domain-containing protein n=1 Tax=uncultured Treponema sp. TaxID=162155 RepID=UPI0034258980